MEPDFSHTLVGGRAGLSALLDNLEAGLAERRVPSATVSSVLMAADEVLSNILDHGGASSVEVAAEARDGRVTIQITDDGMAFDPLAATAPDTTLSVEEREIGGLGIHLVRKLMDEVGYERRGKYNRLRFSKSFVPMSPSPLPGREAS
jgi:serine/threonine-protein kinase RsbW